MCVQVLVRCVPSALPWVSLGCLSHIHVWIIIPSSGWLMLIGLLALLMLIAGDPGWRKCPVAPASAIPISLHICIGLVDLLANSLFLSCCLLLQFYRLRLCQLTWRIDYFGWSLTDRIQVLT